MLPAPDAHHPLLCQEYRESHPPAGVFIDAWPHPLTAEGRNTTAIQLTAARTLREAIHHIFPVPPPGGVIASMNGVVIPMQQWDISLTAGSIVTLRALAQGGDSNPVATVLTLALLFAAPFAAPAPLPATASAGLISGVTAGITLAGGLIINALFPPLTPELPGGAQPKTLYSLTGGANRARPNEPLMLVLGRHRDFPDLSAAPYNDFEGDDVYLNQIFNFGPGDLDVSEMRVGNTLLDSYEDVEIQHANGEAITLVAGNVATEAGGELESDSWITRTAQVNTTRVKLNFSAVIYYQGGSGSGGAARYRSHPMTIEYREHESSDPWVSDRVEIGNSILDLFRYTYTLTLDPSKQYDVRVKLVSAMPENRGAKNFITLESISSYAIDAALYEAQNRTALRIRASRQIHGRLDKFTAIVQQKVAVYSNDQWGTAQATSNPAWLFRAFAQGWRDSSERLIAGAGLPGSMIDDASIIAWGKWCNSNNLECDLILTRPQTAEQTLRTIAQCGRASIDWAAGKLGVVWDAPDKPVTALFTPASIVAGSFAWRWTGEEAAEEIVYRYVNPDLDWQQDSVQRVVPGIVGPKSIATLSLPGVTSRTQAQQACNLQAARQKYHRRRMVWEVGAEGLTVRRGDVVWVTHTLIDGGVTGRLEQADYGLNRVRLNRSVDPDENNPMLAIRLPDGQMHQSTASRAPGAVAGEPSQELILESALPTAPQGVDTLEPMDCHWRWYGTAGEPKKVKIVAVEPVNGSRVRLEAIDELPEYYAAATLPGNTALPKLHYQPPKIISATFSEILIRAGHGFVTRIHAAVAVEGDWRGGVVYVDGAIVATMHDGATRTQWSSTHLGKIEIVIVPGVRPSPSEPLTAQPMRSWARVLRLVCPVTFFWTSGATVHAGFAGRHRRMLILLECVFDIPKHRPASHPIGTR